MHVAAIIAAGGRGQRLGTDAPKQLLRLGGRSILQRSVDAFDACGNVAELTVVVPAEYVTTIGVTSAKPLHVIAGGTRRQDSVANGFERVSPRADVIVVHDAARPLVSAGLIDRTIDAAWRFGAALAAMPARDTVKRVDAARRSDVVESTLPRESIYLAQTPQAFRRDVLLHAVEFGRRGVEATDEAALAERAGHAVHLVAGEPTNLKITTPEDLVVARALVGSGGGMVRVGTGYDSHRLVEGRPLLLGGVHIPFDRGLMGHSDADALCHAIIDAILGAAGAGDIGQHFPDTDPRWKDASSVELLRRAAEIVRAEGFQDRKSVV